MSYVFLSRSNDCVESRCTNGVLSTKGVRTTLPQSAAASKRPVVLPSGSVGIDQGDICIVLPGEQGNESEKDFSDFVATYTYGMANREPVCDGLHVKEGHDTASHAISRAHSLSGCDIENSTSLISRETAGARVRNEKPQLAPQTKANIICASSSTGDVVRSVPETDDVEVLRQVAVQLLRQWEGERMTSNAYKRRYLRATSTTSQSLHTTASPSGTTGWDDRPPAGAVIGVPHNDELFLTSSAYSMDNTNGTSDVRSSIPVRAQSISLGSTYKVGGVPEDVFVFIESGGQEDPQKLREALLLLCAERTELQVQLREREKQVRELNEVRVQLEKKLQEAHHTIHRRSRILTDDRGKEAPSDQKLADHVQEQPQPCAESSTHNGSEAAAMSLCVSCEIPPGCHVPGESIGYALTEDARPCLHTTAAPATTRSSGVLKNSYYRCRSPSHESASVDEVNQLAMSNPMCPVIGRCSTPTSGENTLRSNIDEVQYALDTTTLANASCSSTTRVSASRLPSLYSGSTQNLPDFQHTPRQTHIHSDIAGHTIDGRRTLCSSHNASPSRGDGKHTAAVDSKGPLTGVERCLPRVSSVTLNAGSLGAPKSSHVLSPRLQSRLPTAEKFIRLQQRPCVIGPRSLPKAKASLACYTENPPDISFFPITEPALLHGANSDTKDIVTAPVPLEAECTSPVTEPSEQVSRDGHDELRRWRSEAAGLRYLPLQEPMEDRLVGLDKKMCKPAEK